MATRHALLLVLEVSRRRQSTKSIPYPTRLTEFHISDCEILGVQERRIVCVRDYDQRAATPVLCMDKPRPDIPTTRTCNDHPCPPRWNVSEFGPCSKPCGGGVMTREVTLFHFLLKTILKDYFCFISCR